MGNTIEVWAIKDPDGNFWKTPKGKSTWNKPNFAKSAWNCHNYKPHSTYPRITVNKKWDEDAEGWQLVKLKEYKLVEVNDPN